MIKFSWVIMVLLIYMQSIRQEAAAIISFTADLPAITVDAAEAGATVAHLAWHTVNLTDSHRLSLEVYGFNAWRPLSDERLPAVGTWRVTVEHPLNFGSPTYRLTLINQSGERLDEQVLIIPYEIPAETVPAIVSFTTLNDDAGDRVPVSWQVINRLPTSNLLFEQILADGLAVSAELPRSNLWVASTGEGVVALQNAGSLRLRVVDYISGEVYDEAILPLSGTVASVPTAEVAITATPLPDDCALSPEDVPRLGNPGNPCDVYIDSVTGTTTRVISFTADTASASADGTITLAWQIEGAQFALIEMYALSEVRANNGIPPVVRGFYDALPTAGSATIPVPESITQGVRFILWAVNLSTRPTSPAVLYDRLAYTIIDLQN